MTPIVGTAKPATRADHILAIATTTEDLRRAELRVVITTAARDDARCDFLLFKHKKKTPQRTEPAQSGVLTADFATLLSQQTTIADALFLIVAADPVAFQEVAAAVVTSEMKALQAAKDNPFCDKSYTGVQKLVGGPKDDIPIVDICMLQVTACII
jgi:hypothetical protein